MLEYENDSSASQLRNAAKAVENDDPKNWVEYDLALADSVSQKRSLLYLALSTIIGGVIGSSYVLILKSFRNRKTYTK